jgi:hypothetical protein
MIKKIICIDNKATIHPDCVGDFMVKEGEIYNVNGGFASEDEWFYTLDEDKGGNGWNSIYFLPLSEIDEKQFDLSLKVLLKTKPIMKALIN